MDIIISMLMALLIIGNHPSPLLAANCSYQCYTFLGYGHFTFSRNTRQSGIYVIPNVCRDDHLKAEAYCNTISGGGGWLVVQKGQDGSVDFNMTWVEYEDINR